MSASTESITANADKMKYGLVITFITNTETDKQVIGFGLRYN
jgi:hypothetical protein